MNRVRSFLLEPTFANREGMAPEDVARRRAMAEALWSQGNSSQPVVGVFDGMNRVLQSFLGGRQMRKAEDADQFIRERERTAAEAEAARAEQQQVAAIRQMNNFANPAQPAPQAPADTILPATTFNAGSQNEWSAGDFPGGGTVPRGPQITYNYGDSTIRNQPINSNLENVLKAAADAAGVSGIVIGSGGQPSAAEGGNRTGSTRHDDGGAADLQLIGPDGRVLDFTNPADLPIIQAFVSYAHANGATGIGAGTDYMGNNTLHVGSGAEGVWGAGGEGANAPEWLTTAFNATVPGTNAMRNFVDTAASNPVLRPFVAELLQGQITALMTPPAPVEYGFTDAGDGNIYATNPRTGTATLAAGTGQPAPNEGTAGMQEYDLYVSQLPPGQTPLDFTTWDMQRRRAGAPNYFENAYNRVIGEQDAKLRGDINDAETNAFAQLNTYDAMEQLMNDPNFYSGVMAEPVAGLRRFFGAIGLADPQSAVAIENFGALANESVLKALGGSLGAQISNSDRSFLQQTVPNLSFSEEGNRTLLAIQRAVAQRQIDVAQMARDYSAARGGIDDGFRQQIAQWREANPLFPQGSIPGISAAPSPMRTGTPQPATFDQRFNPTGTGAGTQPGAVLFQGRNGVTIQALP